MSLEIRWKGKNKIRGGILDLKRTRDASDATVGAMVIAAGAQTMTGLWRGHCKVSKQKKKTKRNHTIGTNEHKVGHDCLTFDEARRGCIYSKMSG